MDTYITNQEIMDVFEVDEIIAEKAMQLMKDHNEYNHYDKTTMEKLNKLLGCHGVVKIFPDEEFEGKEDWLYLNVGETYQSTIVLTNMGYYISSWGDETEEAQEEKNEKVCNDISGCWEELDIEEKINLISMINENLIDKQEVSVFIVRKKTSEELISKLESEQFQSLVEIWEDFEYTLNK